MEDHDWKPDMIKLESELIISDVEEDEEYSTDFRDPQQSQVPAFVENSSHQSIADSFCTLAPIPMNDVSEKEDEGIEESEITGEFISLPGSSSEMVKCHLPVDKSRWKSEQTEPYVTRTQVKVFKSDQSWPRLPANVRYDRSIQLVNVSVMLTDIFAKNNPQKIIFDRPHSHCSSKKPFSNEQCSQRLTNKGPHLEICYEFASDSSAKQNPNVLKSVDLHSVKSLSPEVMPSTSGNQSVPDLITQIKVENTEDEALSADSLLDDMRHLSSDVAPSMNFPEQIRFKREDETARDSVIHETGRTNHHFNEASPSKKPSTLQKCSTQPNFVSDYKECSASDTTINLFKLEYCPKSTVANDNVSDQVDNLTNGQITVENDESASVLSTEYPSWEENESDLGIHSDDKDVHEEIFQFSCYPKKSKCKSQHSLTDEKCSSSKQCLARFTPIKSIQKTLPSPSYERPFSCNQCSKCFREKRHLQVHLRTHSGENSISCEHCSAQFTWKISLVLHRLTHLDEKPFSYKRCPAHFTHEDSLKQHLFVPHRSFSCDQCSARFTQKSSLVVHSRIHSGEKPFSCEQCSAQFAQKSSFNYHSFHHSGKKSFSCDLCSKQNTQKSGLKQHLRVHSGEKPFSCEQCSAQFALKSTLRTHLFLHSGKKPFSCDLCSKQFTQKSGLKHHLCVHTGEKPFSCEQCSAQFALKSTLKTHLLLHSGKKRFSCDQCSARFFYKSNLMVHLRVHSGEKPFSCEQCSARFAHKISLNYHSHFHSGKKPFSCDQCSARFFQKSNLIVHLRVHSGEKPFSCEQCSAQFAHKNSLDYHSRLHSGKKSFSCD